VPYRLAPAAGKTGRRVQVRSYLDLVAAELARVQLEGMSIGSTVVQTASFNPLLVHATGGHLLLVDESDAERADEILRRAELDVEEAPDREPEGTVRCPRCEGVYCRRGRLPLRVYAGHPLALPIALPLWLVGSPRWFCERCEHVWDDQKEGPRKPTRCAPGDPRPVFLLWRAHAGAGTFLGSIAGVFALAVLGASPAGVAAFGAAAFLGWFFGRVIGKFVCSQPGCRAELTRGAELCPKCGGAVAGTVRSAAEHFAAAADFRRELAASGMSSERRMRRALRAARSR
jgi:hypothetical protein